MKGEKVWELIGCACGRGYRAITWKDGSRLRRFYIHRAVCEAFNGTPSAEDECRHLNGDYTDNRAANLAWGTTAQNQADRYAHGTMPFGEKNPMAKLSKGKVAEMRQLRASHNTPYYRLAEQFNVSTMTAFRAVTGRAWNEDQRTN